MKIVKLDKEAIKARKNYKKECEKLADNVGKYINLKKQGHRIGGGLHITKNVYYYWLKI